MSILFTPLKINQLEAANRFVRSATNDRQADLHGDVTGPLIETYENLAKGGVGLIITGHACVTKDGKASPTMLGCYEDGQIPGLKRLVEAVHLHKGKIILQINHAGRWTAASTIGRIPVAPSPVTNTLTGEVPEELTGQKIKNLVRAFGEAAVRAKTAGFDGVQIHCAHGYLCNQFLSPFFNRRQDEWGGPLENRMRFVLDIYRETRKAVGSDYPVLIKINSSDFMENGLEADESVKVASILCKQGMDAVEVSGGTAESSVPPSVKHITEEKEEACFLENARKFKKAIDKPLILVGGLRTPALMERIVMDEDADMISLCRPFIRQPDLVAHWKKGDRAKAQCISCGGCHQYPDEPVRCILTGNQREKATP